MKGCDKVNEISKKYKLYLTKNDTTINKTGVKVFIGDDIEFLIEVLDEYNPITQEKIPMDLTKCEINALAYRSTSKTSISQDYGNNLENKGVIEIKDPVNGIFKFKPSNSIMSCVDKIQVQFTIKDADEVVSIQPMLFTTLATLDSSKEIIPTNDIKILRQLEEQIEKSKELIEGVKVETSEMQDFVVGEIDTLNQKVQENDVKIQGQLDSFNTKIAESKKILDTKVQENSIIIQEQFDLFSNKITQETTRLENEIVVQSTRLDGEVDSIESRIDELNIELNNATSFIPMQNYLTPFVKAGENYVSFRLSVADYEAKRLASNSMLLNIFYESSSKQQGLSYAGLLNSIFYEDSKGIPYSYMYLTTFYKPTISGMDIDPSVVFNGTVNKLMANENYYEIWIKTKIPKEEVNNAKCIITTFGNRIGVI